MPVLNPAQFFYTDGQYLVFYLGNISCRKNFTGWFHGKVSRGGRHEFYLLTRGGGTFTVDGTDYAVEEGSLVYVPPREGLRYNFVPDAGRADYYAINFQCAAVTHRPEIWLYDERAHYHYHSNPGENGREWSFDGASRALALPIVSVPRSGRLLRELLAQMLRLRQEPELIDFWEEQILLQRFLHEVSAQSEPRSAQDMNARRIRLLSVYIQKHYSEPLTLEALCGAVGLSRGYVISLFKSRTGHSPMAYVSTVRIEAAKELLRESRMPVAQIAAQVGYQDAFYFSRKFRQLVGCTPRQYRGTLP